MEESNAQYYKTAPSIEEFIKMVEEIYKEANEKPNNTRKQRSKNRS